MCQKIGEEKKSARFLGFVMFLAELYVQFKNERGQRFNVIGTGLLECLENLISEPVICDNLKIFCNALKVNWFVLIMFYTCGINYIKHHLYVSFVLDVFQFLFYSNQSLWLWFRENGFSFQFFY